MQLHQLRDCYRQGWKPDWQSNEDKWVLERTLNKSEYKVSWAQYFPHFLSFRTKEIAKEFLYNFRELIEEAGDLI